MRRPIMMTAAAVAALSITLTSCTAEPEDSVDAHFMFSSVEAAVQYAEAKGYTQQAALLADGEATEEDYRAANGIFRACLEEIGYRFGPDITVDPINGLQLQNYWETVPGPDSNPGIDGPAHADACQDAFSTVEMSYIGTHEKRMDPAVRAHLVECASSQDITIDDADQTIDAMLEGRSETERLIIEEDCMWSGLKRYFPDMQFVGY